MSDSDNILAEMAGKLFEDLSTPEVISEVENGGWAGDLWGALEEGGLTHASVSEELGGSGAELGDAFTLLRVAGTYAAPIPVAETFLAGWVLSQSGHKVPGGPLTIAQPDRVEELIFARRGADWLISGSARHVPWARHVDGIVVVGEDGGKLMVALLPREACTIEHGVNMANEPYDHVSFDKITVSGADVIDAGAAVTVDTVNIMGAAARAIQIAGALDKALDLSVTYVGDRSQFGRPLGKFQAIQQSLAIVAGEVAVSGVAAEAAASTIGDFGPAESWFEVGAAKIRAGEAVALGAPIAHQVHGAMGFTQEYSLHYATRRMWSWRDEFGNEAYWADRMGRAAIASGGDNLWPTLTARAGVASAG